MKRTSFNIFVFFALFMFVSQVDVYGLFHNRDQALSIEPISITAQYRDPVVIFNVDADQLECLATNIYHEARGEPIEGMYAVAHVTQNRVNSSSYPDNTCDVVYQAVYSKWWLEEKGRLVPVKWKCQFTWYCDGRSDVINKDDPSWELALDVAHDVISKRSPDITHGSTHYFNHHIADPNWKHAMVLVTKISNHSFYSNK